MNVAFVASEAVPFAKTGGLGDVIGALPRAIEREGHTSACSARISFRIDVRCRRFAAHRVITLQIPVGAQSVEATSSESALPGSAVKVYLIDQPRYLRPRRSLRRPGQGLRRQLRAIRLLQPGRARSASARSGSGPTSFTATTGRPGLIPVYMKTLYQNDARARLGPGSLLTIHNLAYLGLFWQRDMALTGLDWRLFNWRQLEFHGQLCFMKAGLVFADMLSTVSPTYAREIQTPRYGSGLDGLLRDRQADLRGIVNGIDPEIWSPATEPMIARNV